MNERISELLERATTIHYSGPGEISDIDYKLFAELIVRECAKIADENFILRVPTGQIIKQYFGISDE